MSAFSKGGMFSKGGAFGKGGVFGRGGPFGLSTGGVSWAALAYNVKQANTSNFRAAWVAQAGHVDIADIGDSTMRGFDPSNATKNAQYPNAPSILAAKLLRDGGLPASASSFFGLGGDLNTLANLKANDRRIDYSGGATGSSQISVGGNGMSLPSNPSVISFQTEEQVTKADFCSRDFAAGRNFGWASDGGAVTTVAQTGAGTIRKTAGAVLGALSTHRIDLSQVASTPEVYGLVAYNDTRPEIRYMNWSVTGGDDGTFSNNTAAPSGGWTRFMQLYPPKLAFIECGVINSWRNSRSVATFKTSLTNLVTLLKGLSCDVVLWTPPWDGSSTGLVAQQADYVTAMYQVCDEQNVGLIDIRLRPGWRSYAEQVSAGNVGDSVHPTTGVGYPDQAVVRAQTLRGILAL